MDYWNITSEPLEQPTDKRLEYERIKDYNNVITNNLSVDLNCNVIDQNLRFSRSILSWTMKIVKSDGTNIPATSSVTFVNNVSAAAWERLTLYANKGSLFEEIYWPKFYRTKAGQVF